MAYDVDGKRVLVTGGSSGIDTELFEVPDDDPVPGGVDAVLGALHEDALEVFVPAWFEDVSVGKSKDVGGLLAGSAAYVREQETSE